MLSVFFRERSSKCRAERIEFVQEILFVYAHMIDRFFTFRQIALQGLVD